MTGSHDTLNLLPGSRIIGGISLAGTNDTVNLSGGSHLLTFSGPGLAAATVNSAGPFVVVGNRIATIDATPFGFADRNLMDFVQPGHMGDRSYLRHG
jgi:hypothetical protein